MGAGLLSYEAFYCLFISRFLVEVNRTQLPVKSFRFRNKFLRDSLKFRFTKMSLIWFIALFKLIHFKAYFKLSSFTLSIWQKFLKQIYKVIAIKTQAVVRQSSSFMVSIKSKFAVGVKLLYEGKGLFINHAYFKSDCIGRSFSSWINFPLNTNMSFTIYKSSDISKLPIFHNFILSPVRG